VAGRQTQVGRRQTLVGGKQTLVAGRADTGRKKADTGEGGEKADTCQEIRINQFINKIGVKRLVFRGVCTKSLGVDGRGDSDSLVCYTPSIYCNAQA